MTTPEKLKHESERGRRDRVGEGRQTVADFRGSWSRESRGGISGRSECGERAVEPGATSTVFRMRKKEAEAQSGHRQCLQRAQTSSGPLWPRCRAHNKSEFSFSY
ncbi:hypothetical protein V8G54_014775 [Vigna mungo]|uniref:Uncharacterized protein n=1 Tax=Vigna mungo TaxID=3915 RepID=A0AAQ3NH99_VIGMU